MATVFSPLYLTYTYPSGGGTEVPGPLVVPSSWVGPVLFDVAAVSFVPDFSTFGSGPGGNDTYALPIGS